LPIAVNTYLENLSTPTYPALRRASSRTRYEKVDEISTGDSVADGQYNVLQLV
jgi:hypothetical protein